MSNIQYVLSMRNEIGLHLWIMKYKYYNDDTEVSMYENSEIKIVNKQRFSNMESRYTLKPKFLKIIQSLNEYKCQTVYSYEEVTNAFFKYILSKRNQLFDPRNTEVVIIDNDPLVKCFKVNTFHNCQSMNLLRNQLHIV